MSKLWARVIRAFFKGGETVENIHEVNFDPGSDTAKVHRLWQWSYGQILRIQGLDLPPATEIQFSLQETGGESIPRIGVTRDGVTEVEIPDFIFEHNTVSNYNAYAFIYLSDAESGTTIKKITMYINARPKRSDFDVPDPERDNLFQEAIEAVNQSADRAETAEKSAEAWAHGHPDYPERDEDNAAYYAGLAKRSASAAAGSAEAAGNYKAQAEAILGNVNLAGTQQIEAIEATGTQQTNAAKEAIEAKGKETLDSIPDSYEMLQREVTKIKSDLALRVPNTDYAPEEKSDDMTQPVGKDANGKLWTAPGSGGSADFKTDETLKLKDGILSVNTTDQMAQDNTLPITSAGVYTIVGNIEVLLKTI